MTIYLDFDGTIVEHNYPEIGEYNEGCFKVIKKLQTAGHEIILNTIRSGMRNGTLEEALYYLKKNRHHLLNPLTECTIFKMPPEEWNWSSMKESGDIYIDDIAPGIHLKKAHKVADSKMVDWKKVDEDFIKNGIYPS